MPLRENGPPVSVRPARRIVQILVLAAIIAIAVVSSNARDFSPSRIVLRQTPPPAVSPVTGDTWSINAWGVSLVHPLAFVEEVLSSRAFYLPMLLAVALPLLVTLLLGRVFCSWLCPVGFVLEVNSRIGRGLNRMGLTRPLKVRDLRYGFFGAGLFAALLFAAPVLTIFDPPHVLGREIMYLATHGTLTLGGAGFLLGILLVETASSPRLWCRNLCPSGGGLSVFGAKRGLRIHMKPETCIECGNCDEACPYDLDPMKLKHTEEKFDGMTCDNCGLCRDSCPVSALYYGLGTGGHRDEPGESKTVTSTTGEV